MKPIPVRRIKSTKKGVAPNFRIRDVDKLLDGKDMAQELHRHDFYFVLALQKGNGRHEIDFTSYEVSDHCVFILRPGQVHQLTLKSGSSGYLLEFNSAFYQLNEPGPNQILRQAAGTNLYEMDATEFNRLHSILSCIAKEFREEKEGYQQVIRSNLDIFFIELIRQRKEHESPAKKGSIYEQEKLREFLELLEKNARTQKQVSAYADAMNMSVYQLNNVTRTTLDKTASEVISEYIILESKRYLLATSEQVNQIAFHLGYEDPSYFIRFFRKHTGFSPEAFRTNFK